MGWQISALSSMVDIAAEYREILELALNQLTPRQERIWRMRSGIWDEKEPMTAEDIAIVFEVTPERVTEIEEEAACELGYLLFNAIVEKSERGPMEKVNVSGE